MRSALAVPMRWDGALHGVLSVGFTRARFVVGDDLTLLEAFAELAAAACRNASAATGLALAAHSDGLTGCLNHAALQDALRREIERCARTGQDLSLVLLDLDDFKPVNERHGHLVGDELLRRAGHALRLATRPYDVVARYGGDEFAILSVDADEAAACEIAVRAIERLAESVADLGDPEIVERRERRGRAMGGVAGPGAARRAGRPRAAVRQAGRPPRPGRGGVDDPRPVPTGALQPAVRRQAASSRWTSGAARAPSPSASPAATATWRWPTRSARGWPAMTEVDEIVLAVVEELHRAFGFYSVVVVQLQRRRIRAGARRAAARRSSA